MNAGPLLSISGSFLALVVAAADLGAGPAGVLGLVSTFVFLPRSKIRNQPHFVVS